jgi:putative redox protein
MITSTVQYQGALRTEATHQRSGNTFITDAPVDNNGKGEAFSPTDLLATSLATCAITIMGIEAQRYGFDLDGMTAEVTKIMAANPRRVSEIQIDIFWPEASHYREHLDALKKAGLACPVAKSLHADLVQTIRFHF